MTQADTAPVFSSFKVLPKKERKIEVDEPYQARGRNNNNNTTHTVNTSF
jgi:hypothetical protein